MIFTSDFNGRCIAVAICWMTKQWDPVSPWDLYLFWCTNILLFLLSQTWYGIYTEFIKMAATYYFFIFLRISLSSLDLVYI